MKRSPRKPSWKLHCDVTHAGEATRSISFESDAATIGRAEPNAVYLDGEEIADVHAVVRLTPEGGLLLFDLGSESGTFVDEARVTSRCALAPSSRVRVGAFKLEFRVEDLRPKPVTRPRSDPGAVAACLTQQSEALVRHMLEDWDQHDRLGVDNKSVPKVLEVYEIWGDTILSNRQFPRSRGRVMVGEDRRRRPDFSIDPADLPANPFPVVEQRSGKSYLCFAAGADGRLFRDRAETSLEEAIVSGEAEVHPKGFGYRVPLGEDTRFSLRFGQIVLAGTYAHPARRPAAAGNVDIDATFLTTFLAFFLLFSAATFYMSTLPSPPHLDLQGLGELSPRIRAMVIPKHFLELKRDKKEIVVQGDVAPESSEPVRKNERTRRSSQDSAESIRDRNRRIAQNAGLLRDLNNPLGGSSLWGEGLGSRVREAAGGLLGTTGESSLAGLLTGRRGLSPDGGPGGGPAGIGGLSVLDAGREDGYHRSADVAPMAKTSVEIELGEEPTVVIGALTRPQIETVIRRHLTAIRYCYERELLRKPTLSGKATMRFTIGPEGSVEACKVKSSSLDSPDLDQCLVERIQKLRFPEPKGGGRVVVSYPFMFKAAGR